MTRKKRFNLIKLIFVFVAATLSPSVFAQDCTITPPNTDENGDGYADQIVSPDATIRNSTIDCSNHMIGARAVVRDSNVVAEVEIIEHARVVRSTVSMGAIISENAKIIDSSVDGFGTIVGPHSVIRNSSTIYQQAVLAERVRVSNSTIDESTIGLHSVINDSQVSMIELGENVQVVGANLQGNGSRFSTLIRSGTRIRTGAYVQGPIDVGRNSIINARAVLLGSKFVGNYFKLGEDSTIDIGGDILSNVTIGQRVTIERNPMIGNGTFIGNDSIFEFGARTFSNVVIQSNATIGDQSVLGSYSVVGSGADIGSFVTMGENVFVGSGTVIGDNVTLGEGSRVIANQIVPAGFVIQPNTVWPRDYAVNSGADTF